MTDPAGRLAEKRREIEAELAVFTDGPVDPTEAISFGKRVGDGTTRAVERLSQVAAYDRLAALLDQVRRAEAALESDRYGRCESCGGPVGTERMEALPWATTCLACAARR